MQVGDNSFSVTRRLTSLSSTTSIFASLLILFINSNAVFVLPNPRHQINHFHKHLKVALRVCRNRFETSVLRTGQKINNPFYYAKQKANNPVQNSPAINPAESAAAFRMSFFESRNFSLEIGFRIFFSGHIINRLVISSIEKSRRKNRKKCLRVKCELESSCFSNSLFSTIVLVVIQYKPAFCANICAKFIWCV